MFEGVEYWLAANLLIFKLLFCVEKSNKKFAPKALPRARPRPAGAGAASATSSTPIEAPAVIPQPAEAPTGGKEPPESANNVLTQPLPNETVTSVTNEAPPEKISSDVPASLPPIIASPISNKEHQAIPPASVARTPPPQAATSTQITTESTIPNTTTTSATLKNTPSIDNAQQKGHAQKRRRIDAGIAIRMPTADNDPPVRIPTPMANSVLPGPITVDQQQPRTNPTPATSQATSKKKGKQRATGDTGRDGDDDNDAEGAKKRKRGRKKQRSQTPEGGESLEIEPGVVRMTDLCRDTHIGRKSKRYEEIEKLDWTEIVRKQRQRKAEIEAAKAAGVDIAIETVDQRLDRLARENINRNPGAATGGGAMLAPQMRVVNGQLVLDEQSLQIDRRERDAGDNGPHELIEESNLTRRVNSGTWGRRERTERWDDEETEKFFAALSMFGTDFELISKMFPGRSRRQMKNKFNNEERKNPLRINDALKNKTSVGKSSISFFFFFLPLTKLIPPSLSSSQILLNTREWSASSSAQHQTLRISFSRFAPSIRQSKMQQKRKCQNSQRREMLQLQLLTKKKPQGMIHRGIERTRRLRRRRASIQGTMTTKRKLSGQLIKTNLSKKGRREREKKAVLLVWFCVGFCFYIKGDIFSGVQCVWNSMGVHVIRK